MPIRIDYSPVGSLMNLARSAGEAQGSRESAAKDLAFTQMALQAQTQNAQIGATIKRNDQAFQLQQAALQRQAGTPTRAVAGATPVTQEIDKVLGRMTTTREWGQEDQAAQMEQLDRIPDLSEHERESIRLGIMGGQSLTQLLKRRAAPKPIQAGLSFAQRESRSRNLYQQQRDDIEAERKSIYDELDYEGKTRDADWKKRLTAVTERLQAHDAKYATMGVTQPGEATDSGLNLEVLNTPKPFPATKEDMIIGQIYVSGNRLERWDGTRLTEIK